MKLSNKNLYYFLFVLLLSFLAFSSRVVVAAYPIREGDSVWEISARHLGELHTDDINQLRISKLDSNSGWVATTFDAMLTSTEFLGAEHTIVYSHGNWMDWCEARERGLLVYQALVQQNPAPIRLVCFSWPSEREGRLAPDVRDKAKLADFEAYRLALVLQHLPNDKPLGLIGFSFGARVTCGSLHLLAGGSLNCRTLVAPHNVHSNIHVSLTAPAFDKVDLKPNGRYGLALSEVDCLVNLYNSDDPILKRFRFLDVSSKIAAGFAGIETPRSTQPLSGDFKLAQFDVNRTTGRTHSEKAYMQSPYFQLAMQNVVGATPDGICSCVEH